MDEKYLFGLLNLAFISLPDERKPTPIELANVQQELTTIIQTCNGSGSSPIEDYLIKLEKARELNLNDAKEYLHACDSTIIRETEQEHIIETNQQLIEGLMSKFKENKKQILRIEHDIHYENVKKLMHNIVMSKYHKSMDDSEENNLIYPFILSENCELSGTIIMKQSNFRENITLISVQFQKGKESGVREPHVKFFGEQHFKTNNCFGEDFFIYLFESDAHDNYLLLSFEDIPVGKASVKGMLVRIPDQLKIGTFATMNKRISTIFVTKVQPEVNPIEQNGFSISSYGWTHEDIAKMLLGEVRHPNKFEKLLFAWLFSYKVSGYPLHILWYAPPGTGKSSTLNAIVKHAMKEEVAGVDMSTLRSLVPSFGQTNLEPGYMVRRHRVGGIDELFKKVVKGQEHETGILCTLLEHMERLVASGKHSPTLVKATARFIITSNPRYGLETINELYEKLDRAFLSRFILYRQTKAHQEFIASRKPILMAMTMAAQMPKYNPRFMEVVDYLQKQYLEMPIDSIERIREKYRDYLPVNIAEEVYDARADHHIMCLIDGIAKFNSIVEKRSKLMVTESDVKDAEEIWGMCIASISPQEENMNRFEAEDKVEMLSLNARKLYDAVKEHPGETEYAYEKYAKCSSQGWMATLERLDLIEAYTEDNTKRYRLKTSLDELIVTKT
jgi:hypothetical protein